MSIKSRFNFYFNDDQMYIYRCQGERYLEVKAKELDRYEERSVTVWASVTMHRRSPLQLIVGQLNSQRYIDEVTGPTVLPFLGQFDRGHFFQDDNARPIHGRSILVFV